MIKYPIDFQISCVQLDFCIMLYKDGFGHFVVLLDDTFVTMSQ